MMFLLIYGLCFALIQISLGNQNYDPSTCREVSLSKSTWPSDHGDSSRTKFTVNAGLPKGVTEDDIKMMRSDDLLQAQWLYTAGENSEYLFVLGGNLKSVYVAKLNSTTLEILQKIPLPKSAYLGGLLMHGNGHAYAVHGNVVYAFWNGDLYNSTKLELPSRLNGKIVQTNGMIVASDGSLVVKQWQFNMEDLGLYFYGSPIFLRFIVGLSIVLFSLLFLLFRVKSFTLQIIALRAVGSTALAISIFITLAIIIFTATFGAFDPWTFISTNILLSNRGGGGELKIIDPLTLEIKADLFLNERCSFPRAALSKLENGEDSIVLLGDEFVHQYRWNPETSELYEIESWAQRYRSRWVGTFPGTGPAIYKGRAYFTDNTFPAFLYGQSYSLFSKSLLSEVECETSEGGQICPNQDLQRVALTEKGDIPGFMFWSVVVSPKVDDVIIWDSSRRKVQSRDADSLTLHWELTDIVQGDCITLAADKNHVYMTDYNDGPPDWSTWMMSVGPHGVDMHNLTKFFIVVDAETGGILVNKTVFEHTPINPAVVVPGGNNDIFISGQTSIMRLYV